MQVNATGSPDINAVLAQMRALRAQASPTTAQPQSVAEAVAADQGLATRSTNAVNDVHKANFGQALRGAIDAVNDLQKTSSASSTAFATGQTNDLVKVMIDGQKASVGFQAMVQARNRMVTAYQDIMNMPI